MNIKQICSQASATINRFDIELLLAKALNKPRVYLHSHPEEKFTDQEGELFRQYLQRYQHGEPIAYILGSVEFYSLNFFVSPSVLIPRPETELVVDYILDNFKQKEFSVLELGTGSGVISIALAKHRPAWNFTAVDVSAEALSVAGKNALLNDVRNIQFLLSDWYKNIQQTQVDLIVSNPPYIAQDDTHLSELGFEPEGALVSGPEGLDALQHIIHEAKVYLKSGGWVVLEHGYNQGEAVQQCFRERQFTDLKTLKDLHNHPRVTIAKHTGS